MTTRLLPHGVRAGHLLLAALLVTSACATTDAPAADAAPTAPPVVEPTVDPDPAADADADTDPEADADPTEADIDPRVRELLHTLAGQLAERDHVRAELTETAQVVDVTGQILELTRLCTVAIERPDRLFIRCEGDEGTLTLWKDGSHVTRLDGNDDTYVQSDDPGTIDDLLVDPRAPLRGFPPILGLLSDDLEDRLLLDAFRGRYLGQHLAGDELAHHIALQGPVVDKQLWIVEDDDGRLRVRKMAMTFKTRPSRPYVSMFVLIARADEQIPDSRFEFVAPEGAVPATDSEGGPTATGDAPTS